MASLIPLITNLTAALSNADRYRKLLDVLISSVPCDAACLLRWQEGTLYPLSNIGLAEDVMVRAFKVEEHPRLEMIIRSNSPVIFPADSNLPDPFDGFLATDPTASLNVHSCLGCPLIVEGELMGVLTADAHGPGCFDSVDQQVLAMLAALAGATLRTSQLIEAVERTAAEEKRLRQLYIRESNTEKSHPLLGVSKSMQSLRQEIDMVAVSELPVLITGETGTGKEVVARQIHQGSRRKEQPLIYVNCAALPESIVESELFGHVRGAFTGAVQTRTGKFQLADQGTLFLDEIGELPLTIQPKLLRALQEGEIQQVGAGEVTRVNVRVIAATNRDLHAEVENGRFRSDLYHRLNVVPIHIAPLRERQEDIGILASYFCDLAYKRIGTAPVRITDAARRALSAYDWPGNVRELKNVMSRLMLTVHHRRPDRTVLLLDEEDIRSVLTPRFEQEPRSDTFLGVSANEKMEKLSLREATLRFQKQMVLKALEDNNFHWAKSARQLGMDRSNLYNMAKRLGLSCSRTSPEGL